MAEVPRQLPQQVSRNFGKAIFLKCREPGQYIGQDGKTQYNGKQPIETDWSLGTKALTTAEANKLLSKTRYNIGIHNRLAGWIIIDCDDKEFLTWCLANLPKTYVVSSTYDEQGEAIKGHLYYKPSKSSIRKTEIKDKEGKIVGDIRGLDGNFNIMCPPSVNPVTTLPYIVYVDEKIAEVEEDELIKILGEYTDSFNDNKKENPRIQYDSSDNCDITKVIDVSNFKSERDREFKGNNPFSERISTHGGDFNVSGLKNVWYDWYNKVGGSTLDAIAIKHGLITYPSFVTRKQANMYIDEETRQKAIKIANSDYGFNIPNCPHIFQEDEKGNLHIDIVSISRYISEIQPVIRLGTGETNKKPMLYHYTDGWWQSGAEDKIAKIIKDILGVYWKSYYSSEIIKWITINAEQYSMLSNPHPYLINLKNGVWFNDEERGKCELKPHSKDYMFFWQIPHDYNPKSKSKIAIEKIYEILDKGDADFLKRVFGHCLLGNAYPIQSIVYLYGPGGNGKGTIIHFLTHLLGEDNVASLTLQSLCQRFSTSRLVGKLANLCGDMSNLKMRDISMLNQLTGNDYIPFEFKGQDGGQFVNYAKIIGACNELPAIDQTTNGWDRRQYVIPFYKRFADTAADDRDLKHKVSSNEEEMEALLLWAIDGLFEFSNETMWDDYIGYPRNHIEYYDELRHGMTLWADELLEDDEPGNLCPFEQIYERYEAWCEVNKVPAQGKSFIADWLTRRGYAQSRRWDVGKQKNVNNRRGVKLKKGIDPRIYALTHRGYVSMTALKADFSPKTVKVFIDNGWVKRVKGDKIVVDKSITDEEMGQLSC